MQLIKTKCLPTLLYGLEACPLNSADKRSLEFVFTRSLMKLFNTVNNDIIKECCEMFNLKSVNELITEKNQISH